MVNKPDTNKARIRKHKRVRGKISGTAQRPRISHSVSHKLTHNSVRPLQTLINKGIIPHIHEHHRCRLPSKVPNWNMTVQLQIQSFHAKAAQGCYKQEPKH